MDVFDVNAMEIDQLLVKDVMSPPSLTANKGDTISEIISKMKKSKIREIPVLEDGRPIGLISYSSFLSRRNVPLSAKAEHIMVPCPRLEEDMKLTKAAEELMSAGVRGAPVVRNHKMVGFLSRTDIVGVLPKIDALMDRPVDSFMSTQVQTVSEDETVRKAQMLMKGLHERTLPVVDDAARLIGAIGMTDVMEVLWSNKGSKPPNEIMGSDRGPSDIRVGSVMTRTPVSIRPSATVSAAVSTMLDKGLTTLFVTENNGKLVGVVSHADLMEQVIGLKPREGVYVQLAGIDAEDPEVYDTLYDMIGKAMKRIDRIEAPRVFSLHATIHNHEGMRSKYSISGRLTTEHNMHYAHTVDWDLFKTTDTLLDMLEKSVKKAHERRVSNKKGKPGS